MAFWIIGGVVLVGAIVTWLVLRPMLWHAWAHGEGRHWTMGFRMRYLGWTVGDEWQVPRSPANGTMHGTVFDPSMISEGLWVVSHYMRFIGALWRRMVIDAFVTTAKVGVGDPAQTATIMGYVTWGLALWTNSRIAPRSDVPPTLGVNPHWNGPEVAGNFSSIFRLRPVDIIYAVWDSFRPKV